MAIKIEMLRCFSTVAQTGSLAEAANRLGRTSSAISMTLKRLEEQLGERLFESDRKTRLTPLGEFVLEQAQSELRRFDNTIRAIETFASKPNGLIRIAAVPSVAGLIFPSVTDQFIKLHPGVSVEMRDMDSASVLSAMTLGQVDIGIATSTGAMRNIDQHVLFEDSFGLVCAKHHPLALSAAPLVLSDLHEHPFVQNALCRSIQEPKFQALLDKTQITAQNTLSLISMVRSKSWITVLPSSVIHIDPHQLIFRSIQDLNERRQVDLLYRKSDQNREFVQDFVEILASSDWIQKQVMSEETGLNRAGRSRGV